MIRDSQAYNALSPSQAGRLTSLKRKRRLFQYLKSPSLALQACESPMRIEGDHAPGQRRVDSRALLASYTISRPRAPSAAWQMWISGVMPSLRAAAVRTLSAKAAA